MPEEAPVTGHRPLIYVEVFPDRLDLVHAATTVAPVGDVSHEHSSRGGLTHARARKLVDHCERLRRIPATRTLTIREWMTRHPKFVASAICSVQYTWLRKQSAAR